MLISILFGLLCLLLIHFKISITIGDLAYDLPFSVVFPIIISLAFGKYYGLVAGLSGGALYVFFLWPEEGIANVLTTIFLLALYYLSGVIIRHRSDTSMRRVLIRFMWLGLYIFAGMGIVYLLYNPALRLNAGSHLPPDAITYIQPSILFNFWIKDSINFLFLVIGAELLLTLPFLRRFLGLSVHSVMRNNVSIFLKTLAWALIVWLVFVFFNYSLTDANNDFKREQTSIALFTVFYSSLIVSGIIIRYANKQFENAEELEEQNAVYENLNEQLIETNRQLNAAKLQAEQNNKLKSAFLANITHEIRTPLNGIFGFASLLKEEIQNANHQRYADLILKSSHRLMQTINDVLDIAKIEAGQITVNISKVNVNDLLIELHDFYEIQQTDELEIRLGELPSKPIEIESDKTKLFQILNNLMSNAVKFTKEGEVRLSCEKQSDNLVFFISDTGCGIKEDEKELIFERFRQSDDIKQSNTAGTGLGLAIVKEYTRVLGGKISLESEHGKGTVFRLELPLSAD